VFSYSGILKRPNRPMLSDKTFVGDISEMQKYVSCNDATYHVLDGTLNVELVVTLRWLNLGVNLDLTAVDSDLAVTCLLVVCMFRALHSSTFTIVKMQHVQLLVCLVLAMIISF